MYIHDMYLLITLLAQLHMYYIFNKIWTLQKFKNMNMKFTSFNNELSIIKMT
jgi:hypothetical protein